MSEPTELDKRRAVYVEQIIGHVNNDDNSDDETKFLVDNLLMEWGADAYYQGQTHAAEKIQSYAGNFLTAKHKSKQGSGDATHGKGS